MKYVFDEFFLEHNPETGKTVTYYPDGKWTGGDIVEDDYFHAEKLGITAGQHRLAHELIHHLIGIHYYGLGGSMILRRAALGEEQIEPEAEEGMVTALTYFTFGKEGWKWAMDMLMERTDICYLADIVMWLVFAPKFVNEVKL